MKHPLYKSKLIYPLVALLGSAFILLNFPSSAGAFSLNSTFDIEIKTTRDLILEKRSVVATQSSKLAIERSSLDEAQAATVSLEQEVEALKAQVAELDDLTVKPNLISGTRGFNAYAAGQCTFYVYTKRHDIGSFWGNANRWASSASSEGFSTGAKAKKGAIAVSFQGYYGHVAYVEKLSSDRSMVYLSEMNAPLLGVVTHKWYPASDFTYIYEKS